MPHSQTVTQTQRYLPASLWDRWQAGDTSAGLTHLHAVLRAVLTYLPRQVAQARLAAPTAPAVAGAFAQTTLMFADISGFTTMSERLTRLGREGAEVITGIVNDYFAAMLEIIARHGGDLFKFGGDALLVCFSGERAAARACHATMDMQTAMARFAIIKTDQGTFNLRMKVGLGTGTVFMSSLGSPERLEFAVMGPALGRMAVAESQAEAGEVLMDQATRDAAGAAVSTQPHTPGFYQLINAAQSSFIQKTRLLKDTADAQWLLQRLDALTPYIPPRVLERIITSPEQRMIEGEHRLVTVLFANFYGIDEIIATLGPDRSQEITTILNRHFTAMQSVIHKYGGIVNKVDTYAVGYRIMALFGAPIAHEDDPARAVHAALEMQQVISDFGLAIANFGSAIGMRIGVNTGYVFAGNLGSALRQEYSVMGDEVNLAARLMGVAAERQVLISHSTARHAEGLFELYAREPVQVKGKREPVPNYQVMQSIAVREGWTAGRGDFVGRQKELDAAQAQVDAALDGRGAVLDLSGDPGVGKSRLVAELSAYAGERGMATLRGEAVSYGRGIPYLPWSAVLHTLFEFQEGQSESLEKRRSKLLAGLERAGLSEWAPIAGGVLGVEIPETPLTASLDPQLRQQRFFDVVLQLIQERTSRSPLLLVLDDVQWADAVSLELVTYVARNTPNSPLLFVIVHRPDLESLPWRTAKGCCTLHLAEMDDQTSLDLVRSVLGGIDLSPPLRRLILDRAQGNPLFIKEVARALSESGAIRPEEREEKVWVITEAAAGVKVPATLTGLIMSRVDRLAATNRRLLQVAAVIGVTFRSPVLARVYPYGDLDSTLPSRLDELVQIDLTGFAPPDEYNFRHTLTQEVAYESLSFARRRELHVRVGEDIERHHTGDLTEHYAVLARHFDEGRAFDKAFGYLVKAGDRARAEFANETALDDYRRALEIAAEVEVEVEAEVLDMLEAMGDVYLLTSRYVEAIEQFHEAIAHRKCAARRCSDLLRKVAKAYELQGEYDEALAYLKRGRWVLSWDDEHNIEMVRICDLSGWVRMRRGEMEEAIEDCEQGLTILAGLERDATVLHVEADLYHTLGTVYVDLQGDYAQATQVYQQSTDLRQQAGDLPGLARSYNNLARTAWGQGDLKGAGNYLQRSLEISRQIGDNYAQAFGYNNLGVVSFTIGDIEQALSHYHTALSLRQRIGDSYGVAQTCNNIGEALLNLEQYDEAHRYLERAVVICEAIHSEVELLQACRQLAEVELARDDVASALDYARRARRIAATVGSPELQGIAERVLARIQAQRGDVAHTKQSFEASIELLRASGHQVELARSHYEFGSLLVQQFGQQVPAREHLGQAADLFAAAGAEKEAAQARAVLAQLEA